MAEMTQIRMKPSDFVGLTYLEAYIKVNRILGYPIDTKGKELIDNLMEDLKQNGEYGKCLKTYGQAYDWLSEACMKILEQAKDYL